MSQNELRQKFTHIYHSHVDKIYRFVFIKVNSQEVAEDLTSETFLRVWRRISNPGQVEIEHISGFLYQTARNLVIDFYRHRSRAEIVTNENATSQIGTLPILENRDIELAQLQTDLAPIKKAINQLPENYQDVIILHYLNDLTIPEVAKIMGKSEEAVRMQLHRGLKELRERVLSVIKPAPPTSPNYIG